MKDKHSVFNPSFFKHILFWLGVLLYFMLTSSMSYYPTGYLQLFYSTCKIVIPQIIVSYVCLYVLVPLFLNKKKITLFVFWLIVLLLAAFVLYVGLHKYLYEPKYYQYFNDAGQLYAEKPFWERLVDFQMLLGKSIKFLTPAALLLMARFYKNQQKYLKLNEQKKTAELTALKHQLNPHFLFNTLNNLYALSLKKSDKTPEVIEKLSDILDYMLYRTSDTFVSLEKEIGLIENYLSLEKVRYGKRVEITFKKDIDENVNIAPLLLLTFIENAFKHGVAQELDKAFIDIAITVKQDNIRFTIKNSKPKTAIQEKNEQCIGLVNVKKQLELLYLNQYILETNDTKDFYTVNLKLEAK